MFGKIRFHTGFILLTVVLAAGLGWCIGTREFAYWTQVYADMDAENPALLTNVPLIKYEKSFDFGVLYGSTETLSHEFSITNTGRGMLKLSEPVPENESTTCLLPKRELEPGETIFAVVSCTPKEENGDFDSSVYIKTNVPSEPEIELDLLGVHHQAVWVEEATVEVAGVPTLSVFKTGNRFYSLSKEQTLELSNFHLTDSQYAEFFSFELADLYHYEMDSVVPTPESGKSVTVLIKPGLPDKIFTVTVEADTNIPETPKVQFNIYFKKVVATGIPGVPSGNLPLLPDKTAVEPQSTEPSNLPDKIELETTEKPVSAF